MHFFNKVNDRAVKELPETSIVIKTQDIQYIKCYDSFEVTIEVDKQYWGDVTPYQAQIDELTASTAEKDSQLAAKDAELAQKESEITALQQDNQTSSAVTMALVGVQISPARAAELRPVIEAAAVSLSDTEAAKSPELITRWDAHLGETVKAGDRRSNEDATGVLRVYKCRQGHTTQADWAPHLTPAMWAVIDVEHAGTMDDPIPAATGMEYEYGKYYLDPNDGKTYAFRDASLLQPNAECLISAQWVMCCGPYTNGRRSKLSCPSMRRRQHGAQIRCSFKGVTRSGFLRQYMIIIRSRVYGPRLKWSPAKIMQLHRSRMCRR